MGHLRFSDLGVFDLAGGFLGFLGFFGAFEAKVRLQSAHTPRRRSNPLIGLRALHLPQNWVTGSPTLDSPPDDLLRVVTPEPSCRGARLEDGDSHEVV